MTQPSSIVEALAAAACACVEEALCAGAAAATAAASPALAFLPVGRSLWRCGCAEEAASEEEEPPAAACPPPPPPPLPPLWGISTTFVLRACAASVAITLVHPPGLALSAAVSATSSCRNAAVTEGAGSVSEGSGVAEWGPRAATARAS